MRVVSSVERDRQEVRKNWNLLVTQVTKTKESKTDEKFEAGQRLL